MEVQYIHRQDSPVAPKMQDSPINKVSDVEQKARCEKKAFGGRFKIEEFITKTQEGISRMELWYQEVVVYHDLQRQVITSQDKKGPISMSSQDPVRVGDASFLTNMKAKAIDKVDNAWLGEWRKLTALQKSFEHELNLHTIKFRTDIDGLLDTSAKIAADYKAECQNLTDSYEELEAQRDELQKLIRQGIAQMTAECEQQKKPEHNIGAWRLFARGKKAAMAMVHTDTKTLTLNAYKIANSYRQNQKAYNKAVYAFTQTKLPDLVERCLILERLRLITFKTAFKSIIQCRYRLASSGDTRTTLPEIDTDETMEAFYTECVQRTDFQPPFSLERMRYDLPVTADEIKSGRFERALISPYGKSVSEQMEMQTQESLCPRALYTLSKLLIDKGGLEVKGIFRLSGGRGAVRSIQDKLEVGWGYEEFQKDQEVFKAVAHHDFAAVIKKYLRGHPEPVIPYEMYKRAMQLADQAPADNTHIMFKSGMVHDFRNFIDELPKASKLVVHFMGMLANELKDHAHVNLMPFKNLGVVWGPCLLANPDKDIITLDELTSNARREAHFVACLLGVIPPGDLQTVRASFKGGMRVPELCDNAITKARATRGARELARDLHRRRPKSPARSPRRRRARAIESDASTRQIVSSNASSNGSNARAPLSRTTSANDANTTSAWARPSR